MKRSLWLYGLIALVTAAGCGDGGTKDDGNEPGQLSLDRTVIEPVRVEAVVANGSDKAIVRVQARDAEGRPIANRSVSAKSSNPSDAVWVHPTRTDKNGNAEIFVTATETGTRALSITVNSLVLPQRPLVQFIGGDANYLQFVETPGAGQAGKPLRPAIKVEIRDEGGHRVDTDTEVTLHVGDKKTYKELAVSGVATFTDVVIDEPAESHKLRASAEGLEDAFSEPIAIIVGVPSRLNFEREPSNVAVGEKNSVSVAIRDPAGNQVTGANVMVRVRLYSNPPGAKLLGTLEVPAIEGIATFEDLSIDKVSAGFQLTASARGYQSAESEAFTVGSINPVAAKSSLVVESKTALANGRERIRIDGKVVDSLGNALPGVAVRLIASGTGHRFHPSTEGEGASLTVHTNGSGQVTAWISSSVAEAKSITMRVEDLFELQGTATFLPDVVDQSRSELVPGASSAIADGKETITFEVAVKDPKGNPVPNVAIAMACSGSGNKFANDVTVKNTDLMGRAYFDLTSTKAETKIVTAKADGIVLTNEVHFFPGPADRARSEIAPDDQAVGTSAVVGTTMEEPFRIIVRDAQGNPVPGARVRFGFQDGRNGAALSEFDALTDDDGRAATTLTLGTKTGRNIVTWEVEDAGWTSPKNDLMVIGTPDVAMKLVAVNGQGGEIEGDIHFEGTAGAALPPINVQTWDQFDNPTGGAVLTFSGTGSLAPTNLTIPAWSVTSPSPTLAVTWTLAKEMGPNSMTLSTPNPVQGQMALTRTFTATSNAGLPKNLAVVDTGTCPSMVVDTVLCRALKVKVTDSNDNIVVGALVTFTPPSGGALAADDGNFNFLPLPQTSLDVPTAADGTASVRYKLRTAAGSQTVTAAGTTAKGWAAAASLGFTVDATADVPFAVAISSGDGQPAKAVGLQVSGLTVKVTDRFNNAVPSAQVAFAVVQPTPGPNASVSPTTASTNSSGTAATTLTLGDIPGTYKVTATVAAIAPPQTNSVEFTQTAKLGDVHTVTVVSGNDQSGVVDGPIEDPLVVVAKDNKQNLIPNATVTFSVVTGTGTQLSATSATTNASGQASVSVTKLPQKVGAVKVRATSNGKTADFDLTAIHADPYSVTYVSGGGQSAVAGQALANPLEVVVRDRFDNPVPNRDVSFASFPAGNGTFTSPSNAVAANPHTAKTNANGIAQATWTLPLTTGQYMATATVQNVGNGALFNASATAGTPDEIIKVVGPGLGQDGDEADLGGTIAIRVKVEDVNDNAIDGQAVTFEIAPGPTSASVQPASVFTSGGGFADAIVNVGTVAGTFEVIVTAGDESITYQFETLAGEVDAVLAFSGSGQSGKVGHPLGEELVAQVVDVAGNPLAGVEVTFTSASGSPASVQVPTGADGKAALSFTPEDLGSLTVTATIATGTITTATFQVTGLVDADSMEKVAGDLQFTAPTMPFGNPMVIRVLDDQGDPVDGASVQFFFTDDRGTVSELSETDEEGYAITTFTAGPNPGPVTVTATLEHSNVPPVTFDLTVGAHADCYAGGLQVFSSTPVNAQWTAGEGVFSAGTHGAGPDDFHVRVVEAVSGKPELGLVYDGIAISCSWEEDDGSGGTLVHAEVVELYSDANGAVLFVDGDLQDLESADFQGSTVTVDEDGIRIECQTGVGLSVSAAAVGYFPTVLVHGTAAPGWNGGGFCEEPPVDADVAPGLFGSTIPAP